MGSSYSKKSFGAFLGGLRKKAGGPEPSSGTPQVVQLEILARLRDGRAQSVAELFAATEGRTTLAGFTRALEELSRAGLIRVDQIDSKEIVRLADTAAEG